MGTRKDLPQAVVWLESEQVWTHRLPRGSELRVTCLYGLVWLTHEGDHRDHFLRVEDTDTSGAAGLVLVQAITPSQLLVARERRARPGGDQ
ncbi:MAG: DUF2917 domain-containing protein [Nitrospirae bacterium]|nr:DUF2917 domain-containing protein [Nitrospirota bacterium]